MGNRGMGNSPHRRINNMNHPRLFQIFWAALLTTLLLGVVALPTEASSRVGLAADQTAQRHDSATSVNSIVYITSGTLAPLFQSGMNRDIPTAFNSAINGLIGNLPKQDQGWALQMASALIQPSATLISLTTQANGLVMTMSLSLYPGDPQPTISSMLISFSVLNSTTVQVSTQPLNGSPSLVSGSLSTFQLPLGQLSSIGTTPTCGHSALAVHLQFPISLAQAQAQAQTQGQGQTTAQIQLPATTKSGMTNLVGQSTRHQTLNQTNPVVTSPASSDTNSYIELPASSLAAMGNSVGSLPVSSSLTAKNIQIGVQGSDLTLSADIYDSFWGKIGTAITTLAPTASNGSLAVTVL